MINCVTFVKFTKKAAQHFPLSTARIMSFVSDLIAVIVLCLSEIRLPMKFSNLMLNSVSGPFQIVASVSCS